MLQRETNKMKVLVLNGSPKRDKSDTLCITNAFLEGMQRVENITIHTINIIDKHIEYCTGCFLCKKNGGACIHNDDMNSLLKEVLQSNLLIFSFPLYCYGMPAPLKAFLDRTMPLSSMTMHKVGDHYEHAGQADFSHLKYLMICGCGFPNSTRNFEPVSEQFKLCFPNNQTIITVPESPMFNVPEAVEVTKPRLELVRKAGEEYAKDDTLSRKMLSDLASPMIPEDIYAKIANGEI